MNVWPTLEKELIGVRFGDRKRIEEVCGLGSPSAGWIGVQ